MTYIMSLYFQFQFFGLYNLGCSAKFSGSQAKQGRGLTPDYKDKKIETEKAKTYNTPFLSLKRPDFKYVIFKIVEVSPRNPPAKQHSRFGPIPPNVGRIGCAAQLVDSMEIPLRF